LRMKNIAFRYLLQVSFLFLIHASVQAQNADSALEQQAYAGAVQHYHQMLLPENGLYNGGEYADYAGTLTLGYPYFGPNKVQPGWVVYNGMRYDSLMLWYDLIREALVLSNPDGGFKVQLLTTRIQAFSLSGHHFLQLIRDSTNGLRTGFYEILVEGKLSLYKKSRKNLQEYTSSQGLERNVYSDSSFYLERNGHFLPVNSQRAFLDVLSDKKSQVKSYMRKNKLSFRKNREAALVQIVALYNGLTL
jgi:hypothetical protein